MLGRSGTKRKGESAVCWAALGHYAGHAQGRERKRGWAAGEVLAQRHFSGLNPFLFSKLFSNLQITLNSSQI
jgi:hypothetical protein